MPVKLGLQGDRKEKATTKTLEVSRNSNPSLLSGNDSKEVIDNMMVTSENEEGSSVVGVEMEEARWGLTDACYMHGWK